MRIGISFSTALAALAALVLVVGGVQSAEAQKKGKSVQTEADWVAFDAEAEQITVKVRKTGKGKDAKKLLK
ncbi:MAG: hypothetical protein GWN71_06345, partial [Gammaproteobacteria bacterium]|nr:hypothetical protein [Gammaproteobacteria bacterium]